MRALGVLTLGLVALTAAQGCKQKEPEPIPGPKAGGGPVAVAVYGHPPGIAWFQGSFDEAFAVAEIPQHCKGGYLVAPRSTEMARNRKRPSAPAEGVCGTGEACPATTRHPRHRLA